MGDEAVWLTKATYEILEKMMAADARGDFENAEIVSDDDGGACYLGLHRVHSGSINRLLIMMAISDRSDTSMRRYCINDAGRAIVRRPNIVQEIMWATAHKKPFTIKNDRVIELD
jgi:hypothetical protein